MPPGQKHPRYGASPPISKKPVISKWPTDAQSHARLSWRLGDMENDGPWKWTGIRAAKWREILSMLAEMEKLTWAEACSGSTPRVKIVKVAEAPAAVTARLQEIQRDDIEELVEIRMSGLQRVWGVRRGNVCHLLWWDPGHKVWPAPKKNT